MAHIWNIFRSNYFQILTIFSFSFLIKGDQGYVRRLTVQQTREGGVIWVIGKLFFHYGQAWTWTNSPVQGWGKVEEIHWNCRLIQVFPWVAGTEWMTFACQLIQHSAFFSFFLWIFILSLFVNFQINIGHVLKNSWEGGHLDYSDYIQCRWVFLTGLVFERATSRPCLYLENSVRLMNLSSPITPQRNS